MAKLYPNHRLPISKNIAASLWLGEILCMFSPRDNCHNHPHTHLQKYPVLPGLRKTNRDTAQGRKAAIGGAQSVTSQPVTPEHTEAGPTACSLLLEVPLHPACGSLHPASKAQGGAGPSSQGDHTPEASSHTERRVTPSNTQGCHFNL